MMLFRMRFLAMEILAKSIRNAARIVKQRNVFVPWPAGCVSGGVS